MLSGNRNFEARIHPEVKANYLASPPLVVAYALAGRMDIDLVTEPIGTGSDGEDVFLSDLWPSPEEVRETVAGAIGEEMFRATYADVYTGDETWRSLPVPEGELFAWEPDSTYVRRPTYFDGMSLEPGTVDDVEGARCLVSVGDSVTTDHISPAGSIKPDSPAGRYLVEHGVERKDFNSYGSRRGNHEVMVRGTFANVRLRNLLVPGSEGTWTVHVPSGEELTIFDAAERYRDEGTPLIVLAGKEYGSGSSRDWAAKGPKLLGVRAVIAESYERIHRSNLLMMGVLPLQYRPGESRESLGLTGREAFSVIGLENGGGGRGHRARRRHGVPRHRASRHAARARLPAARRDPPVRAASAALGLGGFQPTKIAQPEELAAVAQVRALVALVSCPDLDRVRVVGIRGEPGLDGLPVERLVAVPVVLRGGDHRDHPKAGRLEDRDGPLEGRPRLPPVLVVVRKRKPPPVRLADDDVAAGTDGRRERLDRVREAAVDEARTEAEGGVVRLRLERRSGAVAELEHQPLGEPGSRGSLDRDRVEVRRDLDAANAAAERLGRTSAGPPRPDAMSRTRDPGPRPSRSPRRTSFSGEVGFCSSWSASATTK